MKKQRRNRGGAGVDESGAIVDESGAGLGAEMPENSEKNAENAEFRQKSEQGSPLGDATEKSVENSQNEQILTQKVLELTQDLQRTRADFENFRKQTEMQRQAAEKSAKRQTVYKLLPVIDNMGRAIESYPELAPLQKSLEKTLKDLNLTEVKAKPGTEFNPEVHEAMMVEGEGEKEVVSEVLQPGYLYEGEVLRPAMVKVRYE